MITTFRAAPDIDVISSTAALPGMGSLAVNAFVFHGAEPMLVDTGIVRESDEFLAALRTVIDPAELRWIYLSHPDYDHIGALPRLLEENPRLRVITTFFSVGILGLSATPLPLDRVHLLNPGQSISLGPRMITAVKPPVYDNAVTTGFHDAASGALFTADCFGALLPVVPQNAADVDPADLTAGQTAWCTIDSPWISKVDRGAFAGELRAFSAIEPSVVLSAHLPPAPGAMLDRLVGTLAAAPDAQPFPVPDQAALMQMLQHA